MHFGITEKPTTDCVSLYNNAGLISKVSEEVTSKNSENRRCRQPHCRLTPPPQETSANIRIKCILPEDRVIGLHFCRRKYGSNFIQFFVVGSSKVVDFGTKGHMRLRMSD